MFVHNNSKHGRRAKRLDPDGSTAAGNSPLALSGHPLAPDSTYDGWFFISFLSWFSKKNFRFGLVGFVVRRRSYTSLRKNVYPVNVCEVFVLSDDRLDRFQSMLTEICVRTNRHLSAAADGDSLHQSGLAERRVDEGRRLRYHHRRQLLRRKFSLIFFQQILI